MAGPLCLRSQNGMAGPARTAQRLLQLRSPSHERQNAMKRVRRTKEMGRRALEKTGSSDYPLDRKGLSDQLCWLADPEKQQPCANHCNPNSMLLLYNSTCVLFPALRLVLLHSLSVRRGTHIHCIAMPASWCRTATTVVARRF